MISHLTVELPGGALRYTDCPNVTKTNGVWPACGINEANVAMTATETITSNAPGHRRRPLCAVSAQKGAGGTKEIPGGIGEEDLVTLVLPYIRSAREGVLRTGALLEQYGTYEPNGMAFADADEVWWLETIGGHHWIARRGARRPGGGHAQPVWARPLRFCRCLRRTEGKPLLGGPAGIRGKIPPGAGYRRRVQPAAGLRLPLRRRPHLQHPPRLVHGPVFPAPHLPVGRRERPLHPGKQRHPLVLCAGAQGDGGGCAVSAGGPYYQGTPYNPYDKNAACKGKYRTIGVPNSDVCGILQIRGYLPEAIRGVEWLSMGGSGFTACFPVYANVSAFPKYLSGTTDTVSTDSIYWQSRLIAALTDAQFGSSLILDERYQNAVMNRGQQLLYEYDEKIRQGAPAAILEEATAESPTW